MKKVHIAPLLGILAVLGIGVIASSSGKDAPSSVEEGFLEEMDALVARGDEFYDAGSTTIANWFYGRALSATSSYNQAVVLVYKEKQKEEDDAQTDEMIQDAYDTWDEGADIFAGLIQGSRETVKRIDSATDSLANTFGIDNRDEDDVMWDLFSAYSPSSPYPDYFRGLVADYRGKDKIALRYYSQAASNPDFDARKYDFSYLADMSMGNLKVLSDKLQKKIRRYGANFLSENLHAPDTALRWCPGYYTSLIEGMYRSNVDKEGVSHDLTPVQRGEAYKYARNALYAYPFDVNLYILCARLAIANDDLRMAARFVNDGIWLEPGNKVLGEMADTLNAYIRDN